MARTKYEINLILGVLEQFGYMQNLRDMSIGSETKSSGTNLLEHYAYCEKHNIAVTKDFLLEGIVINLPDVYKEIKQGEESPDADLVSKVIRKNWVHGWVRGLRQIPGCTFDGVDHPLFRFEQKIPDFTNQPEFDKWYGTEIGSQVRDNLLGILNGQLCDKYNLNNLNGDEVKEYRLAVLKDQFFGLSDQQYEQLLNSTGGYGGWKEAVGEIIPEDQVKLWVHKFYEPVQDGSIEGKLVIYYNGECETDYIQFINSYLLKSAEEVQNHRVYLNQLEQWSNSEHGGILLEQAYQEEGLTGWINLLEQLVPEGKGFNPMGACRKPATFESFKRYILDIEGFKDAKFFASQFGWLLPFESYQGN